jgi:addiction module antidote protein, HigA family
MQLRLTAPPHPGHVLRALCLEPLGMDLRQAAQSLGVRRSELMELLSGRSSVKPQMAARLARVFGPSAESWLRQQRQYDAWVEGKCGEGAAGFEGNVSLHASGAATVELR